MSNIDDDYQVSPRSVSFKTLEETSPNPSVRLFAIIIVFSAENSIVIEFETGKKICKRVIEFCLGFFLPNLKNF